MPFGLVKWIGDAALAVFESATDAVLCGHRVQSEFLNQAERGKFAIGARVKVVVHVGEVNIDTDEDVYGSAVNELARVEKAAEDGEVLLSDSAMRCADAEGLTSGKLFGDIAVAELRECSSRRRWTSKYGQPTVGRITVADLLGRFGDEPG